MKPACVVLAHNAGLFSLINKVVTCLGLYENVQVEWGLGTLYSPLGVNLWTELFEPLKPLFLEWPDIIDEYPDAAITSVNVSALYGTLAWRLRFHELWKKIAVRPEIIIAVNNFVIRHWNNRDVVSALVRATTHCSEQLENRTQSLEEYAAAFERIRKPDSLLHVMACDLQTVQWFKERYDATCYPQVQRTAGRELDHHLQSPQTVEDAKASLIEVLILARSRALIHPISNMATFALYANPGMDAVFLR